MSSRIPICSNVWLDIQRRSTGALMLHRSRRSCAHPIAHHVRGILLYGGLNCRWLVRLRIHGVVDVAVLDVAVCPGRHGIVLVAVGVGRAALIRQGLAGHMHGVGIGGGQRRSWHGGHDGGAAGLVAAGHVEVVAEGIALYYGRLVRSHLERQ